MWSGDRPDQTSVAQYAQAWGDRLQLGFALPNDLQSTATEAIARIYGESSDLAGKQTDVSP